MPRDRRYDDADAVERAIELQRRVERQARDAYVVLLNAYASAGEAFGQDVLRPIQEGDYALAWRGLEAFIERIYDHDPLMREQQSDIKNVLRPALFMLVGVEYLGIDTGQ